MPNTAALAIALVALAASGAATATEATFGPLSPKPSGVDKEGSWHVGENLRVGDYFSYDLCHIGYDDCTEFNMQIWFKVREQAGDWTRWLAEAAVTDGGRVSVGNVTLADQVFEPGSTDPEMRKYGKAFGRSVSFLSYFMPSVGDGEGWNFTDVWRRMIGELCGFLMAPSGLEDVTVPAGTWEDAVVVSWFGCITNGTTWIADGFPFPLKADAYTRGPAPDYLPVREFAFVLADYGNVRESPFAGIVPTAELEKAGCGASGGSAASVNGTTDGSKYEIRATYGPEHPEEGCGMEWLIEILGRDGRLLEPAQFDVLVLDGDGDAARSMADESGRLFLYAPSGAYRLEFDVKEPPGIAGYAVVVYGSAYYWAVPDPRERDVLTIPVEIHPRDGTVERPGGSAHVETRQASPLQQFRDGVPAGEVECTGERVLVLSPAGSPACVFAESVLKLENRGFLFAGEPLQVFTTCKHVLSCKGSL